MGCDRIWKYGDYDIVTDVDKINASASSSLKNRRKGPRSRRSLEDEYELEESLVEAPVIKVENITDSNLELVSDNSKKEICFKTRKINIFISVFGRRFFIQMAIRVSADISHSTVLIHRIFLMLHEVKI